MQDSEVAQAFSHDDHQQHHEHDMHYKTLNRTKVTVKHEAAGKIHSIVVKDKQQQPAAAKTNLSPPKQTKMRIASPRMRATSPRVRAENVSPIVISMTQKPEEEMVHLVVNAHNQLDVSTTSHDFTTAPEEKARKKAPVEEEVIAITTPANFVESGNPNSKIGDWNTNNQNPNAKSKIPDAKIGKLPVQNFYFVLSFSANV